MLVSVDSLTADPSRKTINSVRETAASIVTHEISPAIAHITKPMVAMRLGARLSCYGQIGGDDCSFLHPQKCNHLGTSPVR